LTGLKSIKPENNDVHIPGAGVQGQNPVTANLHSKVYYLLLLFNNNHASNEKTGRKKKGTAI
jgi:hypothetical protein